MATTYTKTSLFRQKLTQSLDLWNNVQNEKGLIDILDLIDTEFSGMAAAPTQATGTQTMGTKPLADETVTINARVYTFVATPDASGEVAIGAAVANSQANLLLALAGDQWNAPQTGVTWSAWAANVLTLTAVVKGTAGNAITLATTVTDGAVSGAVLAGASNTMAAWSQTTGLSATMKSKLDDLSNSSWELMLDGVVDAIITEFTAADADDLTYTVGTTFLSNIVNSVSNLSNSSHQQAINALATLVAAEFALIAAAAD